MRMAINDTAASIPTARTPFIGSCNREDSRYKQGGGSTIALTAGRATPPVGRTEFPPGDRKATVTSNQKMRTLAFDQTNAVGPNINEGLVA